MISMATKGAPVLETTVTKDTPEQLAKIGQTIDKAAEDLAKTLDDLAVAADIQLLACANTFLKEYHSPHRTRFDKRLLDEAREALNKASTAASNIQELARRAESLRTKCGWWASLGTTHGKQAADIKMVCEGVPASQDQR